MGRTIALLLAAGAGTRLGLEAKGFVELDGAPLFLHSYRTLSSCAEIDLIVVVVPSGYEDAARRSLGAAQAETTTEIVVGGDSRQASVRRGLDAAAPDADVVLCHDAARPFASADLVRRVLAGLRRVEGVVPVVASPDTIKRVREGRVIETVPREELGLVQTPQAFAAEALLDAHQRAHDTGIWGTDDAMLLEAAGYRVAAVDGEAANFKVTTEEDLRRAERYLAELRTQATSRDGGP